MVQGLEPAQASDVQAYKHWLSEEQPILEAETKFLDHDDDLLAFPRNGVGSERLPWTVRATVAERAGLTVTIWMLLLAQWYVLWSRPP